MGGSYLHIFLSTFGCLDLFGLSLKVWVSFVRNLEYTGAVVPANGPFILLLSVILFRIKRVVESLVTRLNIARVRFSVSHEAAHASVIGWR